MRILRQGFTLVELMVILAIVAVIIGSAVYISGATTSADYELRYTARRIAGVMESARQSAAMRGGVSRIIYNFDEQFVAWANPRKLEEDETVEDYPDDEIFLRVGGIEVGDVDKGEDDSKVWLVSVQTYDGEIHQSGDFIVDVRTEGTPIGHVVHLKSINGEEFSVEMNPLTGIARIYDMFKEIEEPQKDD